MSRYLIIFYKSIKLKQILVNNDKNMYDYCFYFNLYMNKYQNRILIITVISIFSCLCW
jgi:hypothetical protein